MSNSLEKASKFLSYVLRHKPDAIGLQLDANGWANIDELIACAGRHGTALDAPLIEEAVETSDKRRFIISDDGERIRANQGHSIPVDLGLAPTAPPDILYHGTAARFVDAIFASGLQPRSRHHVHLSAKSETALTVGARHGKPVLLVVRACDMVKAGHPFYVSANGVWLADEVPPQFIAVQGGWN
jgi:putative RNA 2'-phosphotransferase